VRDYLDVFLELKREIGDQLRYNADEQSGAGVLLLPFKDSMGDNFVIRLRHLDSSFVLDDGGVIENALFVMSEVFGGAKPNKLVSDLVSSFGCQIDAGEGLIKLVVDQREVIPRLLHFVKLLVTLDTMLVEVSREERKKGKPQRVSLGPRASQRIRRSLTPLIKAKKVTPRFTVDGLAVPDWMVDFAYKPLVEMLAREIQMVILITVDLAVLDPIIKSAHAFSRAIDIKAAHADYDILVAFDRHGQNSASLHAANFLAQHQVDSKAYRAIDLSDKSRFLELVGRVHRETGMSLTP